MSTISERIKIIRSTATEKKLSQEEFARSLGLNRGAIANYEDAENRLKGEVPDSIIRLICSTYHVSYAWLKDGIGEMMQQTDEDDDVNRLMLGESEFAKAVFRALAKLPPSAWDALRQFVDTLKEDQKKTDE